MQSAALERVKKRAEWIFQLFIYFYAKFNIQYDTVVMYSDF